MCAAHLYRFVSGQHDCTTKWYGTMAPVPCPHLHEFCHKQHAAALYTGAIELHNITVSAQVPVHRGGKPGKPAILVLLACCSNMSMALALLASRTIDADLMHGFCSAQQEWSMSAHFSMAISRMKASSDVLSLLRAIVLMACKRKDRSSAVGTYNSILERCWVSVS
jgi:hypothetical protein